MEETNTYTLDEAHRHFAKSFNGRVWELLQKPDRSQAEEEEMLYAAYACTYHWMFAGSAVHQQRGEWLISRVHVTMNHPQEAVRHAERCFELTESHKNLMSDFDLAYAYEGLARAQALSGRLEEARHYYQLAQHAGDAIQDVEDKSIFQGDLESNNWYGLPD